MIVSGWLFSTNLTAADTSRPLSMLNSRLFSVVSACQRLQIVKRSLLCAKEACDYLVAISDCQSAQGRAKLKDILADISDHQYTLTVGVITEGKFKVEVTTTCLK